MLRLVRMGLFVSYEAFRDKTQKQVRICASNKPSTNCKKSPAIWWPSTAHPLQNGGSKDSRPAAHRERH